jgi:hypothetical protein
MRPPNDERPAPALAGNRPQKSVLGSAHDPSSGRIVDAQEKKEIVDRLDVLEVLSYWKLELQARLARKELIFLFHDVDADFSELDDDARAFIRVSKLLRWARRYQP